MAFVVLSLFNTLRFPLVVLPKALRGASGVFVRCGCYLCWFLRLRRLNVMKHTCISCFKNS